MAAIASLFQALWPGILGAVMAGLVVCLSLRDVTRSSSHLVALKWPAEPNESTGNEAGAPGRRLEG
jgi:hypothetical protein